MTYTPVNYRNHFRYKLTKHDKRDLILGRLGINRLMKDAEPHYGGTILGSLNHPSNIPNDRFRLMPEWANRHKYCVMVRKSGICI